MSDFSTDFRTEETMEHASEVPSTASGGGSATAGEAVPAGSAILRAMKVLEAIAACHAPPQLAEICKAVDLPKPTVFRILSTLEHAGLVAREPGSKRYHCGPRMNQLASEVLLTSPARSARRAILEELVEQVGETCNLTIANGNTVLCLDRVETSWPLKITITAGTTVPIHSSASGKLFMAHMPRRSRERLVRQLPLVGNTAQTITDPARLFEEFDRIRELGYSTECEEYLPGIIAMAVPVNDADGRIVAAVSVHAPISRLPLDEAVELLPELQSAAETMSQTFEY